MTHISKNLGRYNWVGTEKEWCLTLHLPGDAPVRAISQTFPEGEEPRSEDCPPSEIIEMISARLESYFISTGREKERASIQWCRDNAARLDSEWAEKEIAYNKKKISEITKRIQLLRIYCSFNKTPPRRIRRIT